jgi:putative salt-induced outer membrane protein
MLRNILVAFSIISFAAVSGAQESTEEDEGPWSGSLSLGYISTSGNTETTSYNTKFDVGWAQDKWEHRLAGAGNGADESEDTTAESYRLGWRSDYNFTERDFLFGTIDWRKDRFAGVVEQIAYAINYGRTVIDRPDHILALGIGVGYRDSDRADGTSSDTAIGRGTLAYEWIWSETSNFEQDLIVESGSDNTYIESISAVRAQLIGDFALVLSYTIKHNTDVPAGTEKRDTQSAVSIEYAF